MDDTNELIKATPALVRQHLLREERTPLTCFVTGVVDRRRHLSLTPWVELPTLLRLKGATDE